MEDRTDKYKEELILYPSNCPDRLKIECLPDLGHISAKDLNSREYGRVVPGRQIFPADIDIPLRAYDEVKKELSKAQAMVRIISQELARTGTGKITNIEFTITSLC